MRSTFTSSRLVRQIGAWAPLEADTAGQDVAERLGAWLSAFDAIGLQAAHQSIRTLATPLPGHPGSLAEDVLRVRGALASAIARDPGTLDAAAVAVDGYAPFRQRHHELQRQMEQLITPLRDHARQALGRASTQLRQLAVLDAALEQVLATREQSVLAGAATLLERRFEQLRQEPRADGAAGDAWLATFTREWRQALLAEADLRLEPVAGLADALAHPSKTQG